MQRYRIASIDRTVADTRIFRLEPAGGHVPAFIPGQFVFLHMLDEGGNSVAKRPYSIASAPGEPYLEFCIRLVHGSATGRLEKMKVGDVVGVEGPIGRFAYTGQVSAAFIAGGTGIAPFMSMLRYIATRNLRGRFMLFYSARTKDSILYEKELARLQKTNPDIKVVITLTREAPPGWSGECGRISEEMVKKHAGNPAEFSWWACGPVELIDHMKACLAAIGVDVKKLALEGWG